MNDLQFESFVYLGSMRINFPALYPILDASIFPPAHRPAWLHNLGSSLAQSGVTLLEYRNKTGSDEEILADAALLRAVLPAGQVRLILDDRADLVERVGFDGVHVDAGDCSPAEARRLVGPERIVGTFGGSDALLPGVLAQPADYFSIGPVFPTMTKQTTQPPIGVEGVRRLRQQAGPGPVLVAAAGIALATAPSVLAAGANAVAVSAGIFRAAGPEADPAAEFRRWLAELGR